MSIWAINYGLGSFLGIVIYLLLELFYEIPIYTLLAYVLTPIVLFNFLFARHSKAFFLAFDLFCDPPIKDLGDGGGNGGGDTPREPQEPIKPSGREKKGTLKKEKLLLTGVSSS